MVYLICAIWTEDIGPGILQGELNYKVISIVGLRETWRINMILFQPLQIGLCSLLIPEKTVLSLVPPLRKCVQYGPYFHKQGNKRRQPFELKVNISIYKEIDNIFNRMTLISIVKMFIHLRILLIGSIVSRIVKVTQFNLFRNLQCQKITLLIKFYFLDFTFFYSCKIRSKRKFENMKKGKRTSQTHRHGCTDKGFLIKRESRSAK